MPVHLSSRSSRRQFLGETLGTLTVLTANPLSAAAASTEWVLAADTHIHANPAAICRGINMSNHLRTAISQIITQAAAAEAVIVNGDCAFVQGLPNDYFQFRSLLEPLRQAGMDVHMTLGNHDHFGNLRQAFSIQTTEPVPVPEKHLTVIRTPLVNWFLLDSLFEVNKVTGNLGEAQLRWLDTVLDQFPDQPAIVLGHHNLQLEPPQMKDDGVLPPISGLSDTDAFLALLHRKPQVQAYVFGHTHRWNVARTAKGLPLVNLPPVSYVFDATRPSGWVKATINGQGMQLELRTLSQTHGQHGVKVDLPWR